MIMKQSVELPSVLKNSLQISCTKYTIRFNFAILRNEYLLEMECKLSFIYQSN